MWNVKRVLILIGSVFASLLCYALYALAFGNIDAMPPLPAAWAWTQKGNEDIETESHEQPVDQKLTQSFGPNCKEKQWPLRLWMADKGIAFAAGDFSIEKDGKVRMAPFSAALYHKAKAPGAYPEISTIRCDVALITLDRPVSSYSELNSREVIGVEMIGKSPGITLANNRRTAEKGDDIDILITNGNLFYAKNKDLIWTDGVVCLRDYQSKPPTEIRGKGLQMELAKGSGPVRPRASAKVQPAKAANDNGGVERIHLQSDVDMHFWVDSKAGFLGGTPNVKNSQPQRLDERKPPEKAHIQIKTGGPFSYDLTKETAWFQSPPPREGAAAGQNLPIAPDQVHVERLQTVNGKVKFDQLICDRLDLQFRKRIGDANADGSQAGGDKEIETAKATRQGKNEVVLSLDSEQMAAYGTDLFYRAGDLANGPLTILKGEPLKTVKDGHKMVSKELHLFAANRAGDGQKAWAKGPGQIDLIDGKDTQKPSWPTHILWNDTLSVVREKEGSKVFDLMTVVGDASFIDDQQKQELHGEKIFVWIEQLQESTKRPQASGGPRQELHRVLAMERVRALSPDFIIRQANRLNMIFIPQVPPSERLPDVIVARPAVLKNDASLPPPAVAEKKTPTPTPTPTEEKKGPPIELSGIEITGTVFTLGSKKELQDLIVKGNVYVFQPGDKPGEKRIDITGQLLTVKYAEQGHTMVVHGDNKNLARLEMGELILWGPLVTIDRGNNKTDVAGHGALQMPSNKNLDGTDAPKEKKGSRLTIYWNKTMTFDGRQAFFRGGVQAFQQDSFSKLTCENLTAYLDKFVSFKEGQKENQNAKIDKIICDKNVFIDDSKVDTLKQLTQRNLLMGSLLTMDNLEGGTNLSGPGQVRLLAKGNSELNVGPAPADPKAPPAKMEWKLTHVKFRDRMFSNIKASTKNATFYGYNSGVEVFHFATTDINAKMDADRPAKDQLYLRCGVLHVEGRQDNDRTTQYMVAQQNCEFRTDKYLGYADIIRYNEATEVVTFEGVNGNLVRLYDVSQGGQPRPASVNTSRVLYNRRTGALDSAGVKSITN